MSGVHVFAANWNNTLRGELQLPGGKLPDGTLFRIGLMEAGSSGHVIRVAESDSQFHFVMKNLPSGDFDILVGAIPSSSSSPSLRVPQVRQHVTLKNGTNDVTIIVNSEAQ